MNSTVVLLGLIQGLTEFLPVSSSGHLALAQMILGMKGPQLSFDLLLHVATALAVLIFFWSDIWCALRDWVRGLFSAEYRRSEGWRLGWAVLAGTAATGVLGLLAKDYAERALQSPLCIGLGLCVTGLILIAARFIRDGGDGVSVKKGLLVGLIQGVAVFPGLSRSGLTITAGQLTGLGRGQAFKFSFLLSLPAIFGATLLEARSVGGWEEFKAALPEQWYVGAAIAFCSGMLALAVLKRLVLTSKWWLFGVYCLVTGAVVITIASRAGVLVQWL